MCGSAPLVEMRRRGGEFSGQDDVLEQVRRLCSSGFGVLQGVCARLRCGVPEEELVQGSEVDQAYCTKQYYVYITGSKSGTLYIGMTNNIKERIYKHKKHLVGGFTDKYNVDRLLYFETSCDPLSAIRREKQLKRWRREKKVALVDSENPGWKDLSEGWYE